MSDAPRFFSGSMAGQSCFPGTRLPFLPLPSACSTENTVVVTVCPSTCPHISKSCRSKIQKQLFGVFSRWCHFCLCSLAHSKTYPFSPYSQQPSFDPHLAVEVIGGEKFFLYPVHALFSEVTLRVPNSLSASVVQVVGHFKRRARFFCQLLSCRSNAHR